MGAYVQHTTGNEVMAFAAGRHMASGHLHLSYSEGTGDTLQVYARYVLGVGEWEACEGVWYDGVNVPESDYQFWAGGANAEISKFFPRDTNHPGAVMLDIKLPQGKGSADTKADPPDKGAGLFKTLKFPDFDAEGNQIDKDGNIVSAIDEPLVADKFFYSANPARVAAGGLLKNAVTYSRSDFKWSNWTAFRDFHGMTETVDYRKIPNLEGFGLTASYYSDAFTTLVAERVDAYVNFESSTGRPALGLPEIFYGRFEGFVKPDASGVYTFTTTNDDSVEMWIDDVSVLSSPVQGTTVGTATLTAGQFHKIRIDWANTGGGPAALVLKWSAAGVAEDVVPMKNLYPMLRDKPKYEAHIAISNPQTADTFIAFLMQISNSVRQTVEGKDEFYAIEQLTSSFHIKETDAHILADTETGEIQANWYKRADPRVDEIYDVYDAIFRDLDSRYLSPIDAALHLEVYPDRTPSNPLVKTILWSGDAAFDVSVNLTRWQAYKLLKYISAREVKKDFVLEMDCRRACYTIIAGDLIQVTLAKAGLVGAYFLVKEAEDASMEDTSGTRKFTLEQWYSPEEWLEELGLN